MRRTVDCYRGIGFDITVSYDDNRGGSSFAVVSLGAGDVMFSSGGRPVHIAVAKSPFTRS